MTIPKLVSKYHNFFLDICRNFYKSLVFVLKLTYFESHSFCFQIFHAVVEESEEEDIRNHGLRNRFTSFTRLF